MRFVGTKTLAECSDYINLCDLVVDPTLRTDGYDMMIAEAMAYAKPVIVSDVGANSTLVHATTMRDDILIPRGDNASPVEDPGLSKQMGKLARQKIVARFSIPAMVEGTERVYAEVRRPV